MDQVGFYFVTLTHTGFFMFSKSPFSQIIQNLLESFNAVCEYNGMICVSSVIHDLTIYLDADIYVL